MKSQLYECPRCKGSIDIRACYGEDEEDGWLITVEVFCPSCKEWRVDFIDGANYGLNGLIEELGTQIK